MNFSLGQRVQTRRSKQTGTVVGICHEKFIDYWPTFSYLIQFDHEVEKVQPCDKEFWWGENGLIPLLVEK